MTIPITLVLLCLFSSVRSEQPSSIQDIKKHFRREQSGGGCFKILTRTTAYGCERTDGRSKRAPLQHITDVSETIRGERVLLMDLHLLPEVLKRIEQPSEWSKHIIAILASKNKGMESFSSGEIFPNAAFPNASFPYATREYQWNPWGSGLRYRYAPFPVFLIGPEMEKDLQKAARENNKQGFTGALFHVEVENLMSARENSLECLQRRQCDPIGGYSVLGLFPAKLAASKSTILVMTSMDTAGFFLDRIKGGDSSMSGLLTLLTVIDILSKKTSALDYHHRLAFAALSSEPWDYMGSRRMIVEMMSGEHSTFGENPPLDLASISKIVEIGQIGRAQKKDGHYQFYMHGHSKETSDHLLRSLRHAAEHLPQATVHAASESNPGLPPSSLMTWLTVNASYEGIVLEEFDQQFRHPYYESVLDDAESIDPEAIVQAAILLAQSLHDLATENTREISGNIQEIRTIVSDLMDCLVLEKPGLSCTMAQRLMSVSYRNVLGTTAVEHYASIFTFDDRHQEARFDTRKNIENFLFNYMGSRLAEKEQGTHSHHACDLHKLSCKKEKDTVCIGHRALLKGEESHGRCLSASIYFVPSYSLSLKWNPSQSTSSPAEWISDVTTELASNAVAARYGWASDRVWTESKWFASTSPRFRLYIVESHTTEVRVLIAGVATTIASILLSLFARSVYDKRAKRS